MRFDKTINLGQVIMAIGFLLSGVCVWASAQVRVAQIEWKVSSTVKELDDTKTIVHELALSQKELSAQITRLSALIERDRK